MIMPTTGAGGQTGRFRDNQRVGGGLRCSLRDPDYRVNIDTTIAPRSKTREI